MTALKHRRLLSSCLIAILVLMLAAPLFGETRRRRQVMQPPTPDVEATVISLRRLQFGTYVEVMREDGIHEWVDIGSEEGLEVRPGQRVAYSTRPGVYENNTFGWVRTGKDFRMVAPQRDDRVYRGTGSDGSMVFTDNPTTDMNLNKTAPGELKQKGKKKQTAGASQKQADNDVVYVDLEERKRQEALREEIYRYSEQASITPPARKAKRAKPRPY